MSPEPSEPARDQVLYDEYLTTTYLHRNDLSDQGLERHAALYARELDGLMPAERDAAILELGCGVGGFLEFCRDAGYTAVHGVDISLEQVEFCRERGLENVEHSDALAYLEQSRKQLDLVVMSDMLEHVPRAQVVPLLRAVHERLKPGGRVIVRVPNLSNPLNLRTRYVDFTHESGFTRESLAQVLRMAGLEVVTVRGLFYPHRRWLARLVFDRLAWSLFLLFYRHTLQLKDAPVRGKNLLGVGARPSG